MILYSENKTVKLSKTQKETLDKLKNIYKINTQQFIREAIAEKIKREYKQIKEKNKVKCPF
jgi:predicted transcriptional regulator